MEQGKCSIQGHLGDGERSPPHPQAADCLQSYPKCPTPCNDFSRQLTGPRPLASLRRFGLIIRLDTVADHTSHSSDLAAPAHSGKEEKSASTYLFHLLREKCDPPPPPFTPSMAQIDFEPIVLLRPRIASQAGMPEACYKVQRLPPNTISHYELYKHLKSLKDLTDLSALFSTILSLFFVVVFLTVICICQWRLPPPGTASTRHLPILIRYWLEILWNSLTTDLALF